MAAVRIMFFNTYLNNAFFVSITRRSISLFFHPTVLPVWQLFSPPCLKNKSLAGVVMDFAASQRKQYLWARGGLFWWRGGWGGWELVLLVLCAFCSQTRHQIEEICKPALLGPLQTQSPFLWEIAALFADMNKACCVLRTANLPWDVALLLAHFRIVSLYRFRAALYMCRLFQITPIVIKKSLKSDVK